MVPLSVVMIHSFLLICLFILHYIIPESIFIVEFVIYIPCAWVIFPPLHNYICVFLCLFKWYLCMNLYVCVVYTIYYLVIIRLGKFAIYISCVKVSIPLNCWYICVFIDFFVHIISIFTEICLNTIYYLILDFTPYW